MKSSCEGLGIPSRFDLSL